MQPAYGLANGWLVFGSWPDVIRRFTDGKPKPPAADGPTFPLLRVSVKAWRVYLERSASRSRRRWRSGISSRSSRHGRGWTSSLAALEFVDRLEIDCRTEPGLAVVTLTVQTAQPLRKTGG